VIDRFARGVFLAHVASTLFMTGVIWFVQVVHYPLYSSIGKAEFAAYEQRHTALTTWVVAPSMLVEGTTALLLFWFQPHAVSRWQLRVGLVLLAVIWVSTALVQVPCHDLLSRGLDSNGVHRLVWTNWIRTLAWSLRAVFTLRMAWSAFETQRTGGIS